MKVRELIQLLNEIDEVKAVIDKANKAPKTTGQSLHMIIKRNDLYQAEVELYNLLETEIR